MLVLGFTLFGVLLVILQTSVCMLHPTWLLAPDFYYILVAYLAYRFDFFRSVIILFFLGCVLDVFSGTILGMYSMICFCGFFLLRYIAQKLPLSESLYQIPLIGVSYLVVFWINYILICLFKPGLLIEWSWWKMLIRTFLLVALSYPFFRFFEAANTRLRKGFTVRKKVRGRTDNRFRH
ncbi:MAG: rod shape-determining protein MreD [Desulfobacterales bacterium]|nr:MAG: rod shape-determining protein MreD [Desulfobacterales bacterium]